MDTSESTQPLKTPSYMRRATLKYYYKCKENPDIQEHIKERQRRNAKSYYERNKEIIREKQRERYKIKKEEEQKKKEELSKKLNNNSNIPNMRLIP